MIFIELQRAAVCCIVLQVVAVCCCTNRFELVSRVCEYFQEDQNTSHDVPDVHLDRVASMSSAATHCIAGCCSVLHCVAACVTVCRIEFI